MKKGNIPSAKDLRKYIEHNDRKMLSDDDEEIDEDEAFDSDDERKFGAFFSTSKNKNSKQQKSRQKEKKQKKRKESDNDESSEDNNQDEGEESISDESSDNDDIASENYDDDDEEENDGGAYMLSLLDKLAPTNSNVKNGQKEDKQTMNPDENIPESEFSSSVLRSSNLTIDHLMSGITDTKGFSKVQTSMKEIIHPRHHTAAITKRSNNEESSSSKALTTTLAPVSRIVSERMKRKVNYEHQKQDIKQWNSTIRDNRKAETLDFRPQNLHNQVSNTADMVSKFEPETDFEKQIHAVLEAATDIDATTTSDTQHKIDEWEEHQLYNDDLGEGKMTMEQYEARRGQLAKMRALMFYEEQKRHHINKIKSKKYRKIRKGQRERLKDSQMNEALQDGDMELLDQMKQKEEMERMQERMSLAHKNTSKWAKRQLRRGKALDVDTRRALSAQIQKGNDLKKKMGGIRGRTSNESDDDSEDNSNQNLIDKAKSILNETKEDLENDGNDEGKKGLFKMSFMQKGLKIQRERAKAEAQLLLEELEGDSSNDIDDDHENEDQDWNNDETNNSNKNKREKAASSEEIAKVLPAGKLVVSSLEFGKSNSISVDGNISVDLSNSICDKSNIRNINNETKISSNSLRANAHSQYTTKVVLSNNEESNDTTTNDYDKEVPKITRDRTQTVSIIEEAKKDSSSNPWLSTTSAKNRTTNIKIGMKQDEHKNALLHVKDATSTFNNTEKNDNSFKTSSNKPNTGNENGTIQMTQEELVRKAFAAPSEVEVEEEFQKEKEELRENENPIKKEDDMTVKGWGSWTGEGTNIPPPPRKKKTLTKHSQPPKKKLEQKPKRKDDHLKNVIISAKRVKKNASFQIGSIPYPYQSREQYEKAMAGGIGKEWNVSGAVKNMTRPEIVTRIGKMIQPISKKAKIPARGPAKF